MFKQLCDSVRDCAKLKLTPKEAIHESVVRNAPAEIRIITMWDDKNHNGLIGIMTVNSFTYIRLFGDRYCTEVHVIKAALHRGEVGETIEDIDEGGRLYLAFAS